MVVRGIIFLLFCWGRVRPQSVWSGDVLVLEGETAQISCKLRGYDGSIVVVQNPNRQTLFFNGTQALKDDRMRLVGFTPQELTVSLSGVTVNDEGNYYCQLYTEDTHHHISHLTVLVPPEPPSIETLGSEPIAGGFAELLCTVSRSKPPATIHWVRHNQRLTGNVSQEVVGKVVRVSSRIRFPVDHSDDGDRVTCGAVLPGRGDTQRVTHTTLSVQYSPRVSIPNPLGVFREGNRLILNCAVSANPPPESVSWRRLNDLLPEGSEIRGRSLVIASVSVFDNGTYVCQAENSLGHASAEYTLVVYGRGAVVETQTEGFAVIGGISALLIFAVICGLIITIWCSLRQKGSYLTHEATGLDEHGEAREAFINGTENHEKEYFI